MTKETKVEISSGNVFRDLGFDNPDLEMFKANICIEMQKLHEFIHSPKPVDTHAKQAAGFMFNALGYVVKQYGGRSLASHLTSDCTEAPSSTVELLNAYNTKKAK